MTTNPPGRSMLSSDGRAYVGGYADEQVTEIGTQDGSAGVNVADMFGENTTAHGAGLVVAAHEAQKGLIGHELAGIIGALDARRHDLKARHGAMVATFTRSLGRMTDASMHRANIAFQRTVLGLGAPHVWAPYALFTVILVLFLGEIGLLASALQSMGLSDVPLIPGVSLTDELHIAALATVVSLALVSHAAGDALKHLKTNADIRRLEIDNRVRARQPKPSRFAMVVAFIAGVCGIVAVAGMVGIRGEYLAESGSEITAGPFVLIQIALLAAAVFAAYFFADPTAAAYISAVKTESNRVGETEQHLSELESLAAEHNKIADTREAEIRGAIQHALVDQANAKRQANYLYPRAVLHGLPEPVADKLFAAGHPAVQDRSAEELRVELVGDKSSAVAPLSNEKLRNAFTAAVAKVAAREQALRALLDERVLPTRPANELDYATAEGSSEIPEAAEATKTQPSEPDTGSESAESPVLHPVDTTHEDDTGDITKESVA